MKLFRFDPEIADPIELYKSSGFRMSRIAHLWEEAVVNCAYLQPQGGIGYHQATTLQLFLVVQGEGWVQGETLERKSIKAGQAAYWERGEWHESGTDTGLTAIIIEAAKFDLSRFIPLD